MLGRTACSRNRGGEGSQQRLAPRQIHHDPSFATEETLFFSLAINPNCQEDISTGMHSQVPEIGRLTTRLSCAWALLLSQDLLGHRALPRAQECLCTQLLLLLEKAFEFS